MMSALGERGKLRGSIVVGIRLSRLDGGRGGSDGHVSVAGEGHTSVAGLDVVRTIPGSPGSPCSPVSTPPEMLDERVDDEKQQGDRRGDAGRHERLLGEAIFNNVDLVLKRCEILESGGHGAEGFGETFLQGVVEVEFPPLHEVTEADDGISDDGGAAKRDRDDGRIGLHVRDGRDVHSVLRAGSTDLSLLVHFEGELVRCDLEKETIIVLYEAEIV